MKKRTHDYERGGNMKKNADWMDPTCRKILTESLGEEKVADIDAQYHRSVKGQQIMLDAALKAFAEDRRVGGSEPLEKFTVEWVAKEAAKRTNAVSMEAYREACACGPVARGPFLIEGE